MADQMLDCDFRLAALKKKYYKKFNKSASGSYGDEVLSIGASRRLDDGYASRILPSSAHPGTIHRAGK